MEGSTWWLSWVGAAVAGLGVGVGVVLLGRAASNAGLGLEKWNGSFSLNTTAFLEKKGKGGGEVLNIGSSITQLMS